MEDDAVFSATRLEIDTGRVRNGEIIQTARAEGWIGGDYRRFAWKGQMEREGGD